MWVVNANEQWTFLPAKMPQVMCPLANFRALYQVFVSICRLKCFQKRILAFCFAPIENVCELHVAAILFLKTDAEKPLINV